MPMIITQIRQPFPSEGLLLLEDDDDDDEEEEEEEEGRYVYVEPPLPVLVPV